MYIHEIANFSTRNSHQYFLAFILHSDTRVEKQSWDTGEPQESGVKIVPLRSPPPWHCVYIYNMRSLTLFHDNSILLQGWPVTVTNRNSHNHHRESKNQSASVWVTNVNNRIAILPSMAHISAINVPRNWNTTSERNSRRFLGPFKERGP